MQYEKKVSNNYLRCGLELFIPVDFVIYITTEVAHLIFYYSTVDAIQELIGSAPGCSDAAVLSSNLSGMGSISGCKIKKISYVKYSVKTIIVVYIFLLNYQIFISLPVIIINHFYLVLVIYVVHFLKHLYNSKTCKLTWIRNFL